MFSGQQSPEKTVPLDVSASGDGILPSVQPAHIRFLERLISRLRTFVRLRAPVGYQDLTGFHFASGTPDTKKISAEVFRPPSMSGVAAGGGAFAARGSTDSFQVNFRRVVHPELKQGGVGVKLEI